MSEKNEQKDTGIDLAHFTSEKVSWRVWQDLTGCVQLALLAKDTYDISVDTTGRITLNNKPTDSEAAPAPVLFSSVQGAFETLLKAKSAHESQLTQRVIELTQQVVDLQKNTQRLTDEMAKVLEDGRKKYIPVGGNKKHMFMAGMTFGRQQEKNVRNGTL